MSDRDCQNCINGSVTGCVSWDCNFISRKEAREAVKQTKWIPVSERLPETDDIMLVTYIDDRDGEDTIWLGWHEMENIWYIDGFAHGGEYGNRVIAWMPLPEPYKEDEA